MLVRAARFTQANGFECYFFLETATWTHPEMKCSQLPRQALASPADTYDEPSITPSFLFMGEDVLCTCRVKKQL